MLTIAEGREMSDEQLHALIHKKQANGCVCKDGLIAEKVLYERYGEPFSRKHNPENAHRDGFFIGGEWD